MICGIFFIILTLAVFDAALFHEFFPARAAIFTCVRYSSTKPEINEVHL